MKNWIRVLVGMILAWGVANAASAQTSITGPAKYQPQLHDTLWGYNTNWRPLLAANPQLRHFKNKRRDIVILLTDKEINIPAGYTIKVSQQSTVARVRVTPPVPASAPIVQVQAPPQPPAQITVQAQPVSPLWYASIWQNPGWWIFLGLVALAIAIASSPVMYFSTRQRYIITRA